MQLPGWSLNTVQGTVSQKELINDVTQIINSE
jgi:hypothetical protein